MATSTVPTILTELDSDEATARLRHYFRGDNDGDAHPGAAFTTLGHPWDHKKVVATVTPADLLAMSTLGASVRGSAAVAVLSRKELAKAAKQLRRIPADVKLTEKKAGALLGNRGPVRRLWERWSAVPGMGPVSTATLLARKRPRLLPTYDAAVAQSVGAQTPQEHLAVMRDLLLKDRHGLWVSAKELRKRAGLDRSVSPLRALDALAWHRVHLPDWQA